VQVSTLDIEDARGCGNVPLSAQQDALYVLLFTLVLEVAQGQCGMIVAEADESRLLRARFAEERRRKLVGAHRIAAKNHQTLADVSELANIARPRVSLEQRKDRFVDLSTP